MRVFLAATVTVTGLAVLAAENPTWPQVKCVRSFRERDGAVRALCFSADGKRLLSMGGKTVRLWDPATGKSLARFTHGNETVGGAALAPDGKTVAAAFGDTDVLLLDAATGAVRHKLVHPKSPRELFFCPDGKTLISLCDDQVIRVWDVATGKGLRALRFKEPSEGRKVWRITFSPDGKTVAAVLDDDEVSVRLCDVATGEETGRLIRDKGKWTVNSLAFSPDGRLLAAGGDISDPVIRLWEVATGRLVREFGPPRPKDAGPPKLEAVPGKKGKARWESRALAFSPDGKTLVNAYGKMELWEVETGRLRHQFASPETALAFAPDGFLLATSGEAGGFIHLWDWRNPNLDAPSRLGPKEFEKLWSDMGSQEGNPPYKAIADLAAHPRVAVGFLERQLTVVEPVTPAQLARLIKDLDDESFEVREKATRRLASLVEAVRPALVRVLEKDSSAEAVRRARDLLASLDGPLPTERLRNLRAVEALEYIGTVEARRALKKIAEGASGARETEDARAALKRLLFR